MKYLLDANTCIYIMNRRPSEAQRMFSQVHPGDVGVSTATLSELWYGAENSDRRESNRDVLRMFLTPLVIVPYDASAAEHYGMIRAKLRKVGTPIGAMDLLIAAHAMSLDVILVTNNLREFRRIPGLRLENWAKGRN